MVPNNQGIAQEEVSVTEWHISLADLLLLRGKEVQIFKPQQEAIKFFRIDALLFLDLNLWIVLDCQGDKEVKIASCITLIGQLE